MIEQDTQQVLNVRVVGQPPAAEVLPTRPVDLQLPPVDGLFVCRRGGLALAGCHAVLLLLLLQKSAMPAGATTPAGPRRQTPPDAESRWFTV